MRCLFFISSSDSYSPNPSSKSVTAADHKPHIHKQHANPYCKSFPSNNSSTCSIDSYSIESTDQSSSTSMREIESNRWQQPLTILIASLLIVLLCTISFTLIFLLPASPSPPEVSLSPSRSPPAPKQPRHHVHRPLRIHAAESSGVPVRTPHQSVENKTAIPDSDDSEIVESGPGTELLDPIIESKSGLIIGTSIRVNNRTVNTFLGIPYALAPIGDRRFKRPEPIGHWGDEALEAKNYSDPCVQFIPPNVKLTPWISENNRNGSEDCLYLNIWSPEDDSREGSDLKTVMVWLHGGAFFSGSSDLHLYSGETLAAVGDVVVVSVNYRLGALGFLTTNADEISGNMGMYDQVLALNWIRENAEHFGGNSENIVLFGQSAGATSAGLHLFSPLSKDIPSRVILQSGGPLFPKIYYENQLEKSNLFTHHVGCGNKTDDLLTNSSHVLDCLMNLSLDEIMDAHKPLFEKYKIPFFPHAGDDFLPDLPHELIHDPNNLGHQTEILLGNMEDEGSFFLHLFFPEIFQNLDNDFIKNFTIEDARHYIAKAYSFIPENQAQVMSQFFLSSLAGIVSNNSRESVLKATHDIIGDSGFVCPAVLMSQLMSDYNITVFHYLMTGKSSKSKWSKWMGSTHMDEVEFVFGQPIKHPERYSQEEYEFSRQIINTWTTFAKTGTVGSVNGITWPSYSKESPSYLEINATHTRVKLSPHKTACNLWNIIYDSFL